MTNTPDMSAIMAGIGLGYDIEAFVESKLGKYLLDRARDEAMTAMEELKAVDATDSKRIAQLQNLVQRAEGFEGWLIEGLQQGKAMEAQLELSQSQE